MEKEQVDELVGKWIGALRSEDFTQGYEWLKSQARSGGYRYCCLGVLCELAGLESNHKSDGEIFFHYKDSSATSLPYSFRREIGMDAKCHRRLMSMNDDGDSFEKIADYIDKNKTTIFPVLGEAQ